MFTKSLAVALVSSALLTSAAFAQSPSTSTTTAPAATTTSTATSAISSYTGNWRASKVVGLNVYNDGNESLGSINDLLTDKSGKIVAAVIGVGGFLGVGEHYVAIPFDKIKFVNEPVKTSTAANSGGAMGLPTTPSATTGAAGGGMSAAPAATPAVMPNPWHPDHAVISGTKDELKALPEFKYNNS